MDKHFQSRFHNNIKLFAILTACLLVASTYAAANAYATPASTANDDIPTRNIVANTMIKTPMLFEENRGQSRNEIDFISRGFGYSIGLSAGGIASIRLNSSGEGGKVEYLLIKPVDAALSVADGSDKHQATFNYYKGSDKSKWVTGAESFR